MVQNIKDSLQPKKRNLCLPVCISVSVWSYSFLSARAFFKLLHICKDFIVSSTVERNKAQITPEVNPLGSRNLLTKNHDAHSKLPFLLCCYPGSRLPTNKPGLFRLFLHNLLDALINTQLGSERVSEWMKRKEQRNYAYEEKSKTNFCHTYFLLL